MSDNLTPGFMVRAFAVAAVIGASIGGHWGAIFHDMPTRNEQPLTQAGHVKNALAGAGFCSAGLTLLFAGVMFQRRREEDRAALEGMKQVLANKSSPPQPVESL